MKNKVAICIPTCGGPYLHNCLESLSNSDNLHFDVYVVFNGNVSIFNKFDKSQVNPFKTYFYHISETGVVHVRNFFLNKCFVENDYEYIIMLDDDQRVSQNWFSEMNSIFSNGYDIVGSYVKPYFHMCEERQWMNGINVYYLNKRSVGDVDIIHGTGGSAFSRNVVKLLDGKYFDPIFAATGGEDADFFIRAKIAGATFFRCEDAVCFETIDKERSNISWAKKRYYRIGYCDAKLHHKYSSNIYFYFLAFLSLPLYAFISVFHYNHSKRVKFKCLMSRQLGKISFILGENKNFYVKGNS